MQKLGVCQMIVTRLILCVCFLRHPILSFSSASVDGRFPEKQLLSTDVEQGGVDDYLEIKFSKPIEGSRGGDDEGSFELDNAMDFNEQHVLDQAANQVLNQLGAWCNSYKRIFRHAGKFEQEHVEHGLNRWYEFHCPSSVAQKEASGNSTFGEPSIKAMKITEQQQNIPTKGKATEAALLHLMQITENSEFTESSYFELPVDIEHAEPRYQVNDHSLKIDGKPYTVPFDETLITKSPSKMLRKTTVTDVDNNGLPDDTYLSYQTHYDLINLKEAWKFMNQKNRWKGAANINVHISDAGWDTSHFDLGGNMWTNPNEKCNDGIDDDNNGYKDDCNGYNFAEGGQKLLGNTDHGCHTSGTIAANTFNSYGVAGVAGGTKKYGGVKIMTGVIIGMKKNGGIQESMTYAADMGAHISSNSWGFVKKDVYPTSMKDAIDYAEKKDVLVVFAAGNEGSSDSYYPAAANNVISVGSIEPDNSTSSFSNYGDTVNIAAPGRNILSTSFANRYNYQSGTSMACPHVAGVLALGKAIYPAASRYQLTACLYSTATDIKSDRQLGVGRIEALQFLMCVDKLGSEAAAEEPSIPSTNAPTGAPAAAPTKTPTANPTGAPTASPTVAPTSTPTVAPTAAPTSDPSIAPTEVPTNVPTESPSELPSTSPTTEVTDSNPTPAESGITNSPTHIPSIRPSDTPSTMPTSERPTESPTKMPLSTPSLRPTLTPTTISPSSFQSSKPSDKPSTTPTSERPTESPTEMPSSTPSLRPTLTPTTITPSSFPSSKPSTRPIVSDPEDTDQDSNQGCCSQNFRDCISWCGKTRKQCEACQSGVVWISNIQQSLDCRARWEDCTYNETACCSGLHCGGKSGDWYRQCKIE